MSLLAMLAAIAVFFIIGAGIVFSSPLLQVLMTAAIFLFAFFVYSLIQSIKRQKNAGTAIPAAAAEAPGKPSPAAAPSVSEKDIRQQIDEEKLAAISKFCSVISHELRNPLASLKNIDYFLSHAIKIEDERTNKMLGMMSSEIDRTNDMISNLTDISHLKRMNKLLSDVGELTTGTLNTITVNEKIHIEKNIEPVSATVDPDKFKKIINHLLSNAIAAMPNGGIIKVALQKKDTCFTLTVEDNGTGMDKDTLAHAFEPMFTTKTKSLGLGLTYTKEVAALHGGTVTLSSEKDKGTTFTLTLPL